MSDDPYNESDDDVLPATSKQQEDDFQAEWLAIGETVGIEPRTPFEIEILIVATREDDEETGLVSLILDPMGLRKMHAQLGEIIDDQNYLMTGTIQGASKGSGVDDTPKISKFELITDPAGMSRIIEKTLSGESPVKGMDWKTLLFVFFALLTITLMAIRGVVG